MASNNYAYQLSKYNSYNIDDLITAGESGWKHLEKYAKLQSSYEPKRSGDKSKTISERIRLTLDELTDPLLTHSAQKRAFPTKRAKSRKV